MIKQMTTYADHPRQGIQLNVLSWYLCYNPLSAISQIFMFSNLRVIYVTITTFLLLSHAKITCEGVALSLFAISFTGLSTGPPGNFVIELRMYMKNQQHVG